MQFIPLLGLRVDLLAFVTIYFGLLSGWKRGLGTGLLAGILQDIFSGGVLGLAPIGLVTCGLLAGYSKKMLILRYWFVRVSLVFILTLLNMLIYFSLLLLFSQGDYLNVFKSQWLAVSLGNTVIAVIVFLLA